MRIVEICTESDSRMMSHAIYFQEKTGGEPNAHVARLTVEETFQARLVGYIVVWASAAGLTLLMPAWEAVMVGLYLMAAIAPCTT